MSMDPAEDHEIFGITVIKELGLVDGIASVGGAFLVGNHKLGDEKCV